MSTKVVRYDAGKLQKALRTDAGFLKAPATITRTGILKYRMPDGSVRSELRLPEEVFNADSLSSLQLVPVTLNHPQTPTRLLTKENVKLFSVGQVGENIERNGNTVQANLMITANDAIESIDSGKTVQISAGYTTELDFTPGVYEGERYDAIQRTIRYNHVAVVESARCGPEARLHLDSATEIGAEIIEDKKPMVKIKIGNVDYDCDEQVAQAITVQMSVMQSDVSKEKARADSAQAKIDALEGVLAQEKKARADAEDPKVLADRVSKRVALERQAASFLGDEVKLDTLSDNEVMVQVISKALPAMADKLKDASADYVKASFDFAVASAPQGNQALAALNKQAARADGAPSVESLRKAFIDEQNSAWKKPLTPKSAS